MNFRIKGLDPKPFAPYFAMGDDELARHDGLRKVSDSKPGFPCRVTMRDLEPGETVLLLNYEHLPVHSPYRSRHAVYVGTSQRVYDEVNQVPQAMRDRLLAIRAFDEHGFMVDADIVEGRECEPLIERLLAIEAVKYLHAHYARRGCYAG